ncbi:MAG TPA: hypothetical protein DCW52_04605 [Gammaproteobacteria bacterium]|jgi:hypothetical protein|nr:hypothetical protein [Gammaproteobacteria bacterium]
MHLSLRNSLGKTLPAFIKDPVSTFTYVSPTEFNYFQLDGESVYLRPVKWLLETGYWVDTEVWYDTKSWVD